MRRWTDGKSWSASRVSGSFLTYREMEGKRGGGSFVPPPVRRQPGKTPDSGRGSDDDLDMDVDGPDGYRYKPDGLMKQSFSITTSNGQHLHLISYYARPHANAPDMLQPTTDPALRHIVPVKGMYPESTVHEQPQGPPVTRAPMQSAYSPQQAAGPQRPPYAYALPPGYSWPPSPIATPPYQYVNGGYPSHLPPPGSAHVSPAHHAAHYPHPAHMAPHHTVFDRAPPPLQNTSLPPPPSASHQFAPISHSGHQGYAPNPSPRASQSASAAEQQSRLPQVEIDPRITSTAAAAIQQSQAQAAAEVEQRARAYSNGQITPTSMTAPALKNDSPKAVTAEKPASSQAQTIPSISSLIHAHDSPPRATQTTSEPKSNNTSRTGSASPNGTKKAEGPKDIPHDKMRFGQEDLRALRTLDRKFCI